MGATREVTGSKHLITTKSGLKILLDCGMYQGKGLETDAMNRDLGFDPEVIDSVIDFALEGDYDYAATDPASFPDGLDTEVFKFSALKRAYEEASLRSEREHVTPYIWKNGTARGGSIFKSAYLANPAGTYGAENYRITLDEPEDFEVLSALIRALGIERGWKEYIDYLEANPGLKGVNSRFGYNEGYAKSLREDAPAK